MHFSSNKYSGRRNSFVGFRGAGRHQQKTFDPSVFIGKIASQQAITSEDLSEEKYAPKHAFSDFPVVSQLKVNITRRGYVSPTPIQDQAIPQILAGRDVVGIANTGTGKTAAFLIPLINKASLDRTQRVLIITPTRELAVQIRDELTEFSSGMNIDSVLAIGGVSMGPQAMRLRRDPQFVIGTPGRLRDLEENRALNFSRFNNIVLDEVDRMLDIGFVREIKYIVYNLPRPRQSLFFSATLTPDVTEVMQSFLTNPVMISVKSTETVKNVRQEVIRINGKSKIEVLHDLLIKEEFSKVLVFGRTKFGMEKLARDLEQRGFRVAAIHGNKNQSQRQRALNDFKNSLVQVLLATDIASRGLDIEDVTHVINYDLPESQEDYVHRIGRTGRANKGGTALTFV
ncbi:MAG: DEAD/DEAH box helicase-like protein [Microgenomates group bacterium GW2011_GWA1_48_10]|nr:MAG: DEAD/DEAH box helicase-like protein [Microgenomates group bacterium GW2011_GWA1_48_10]